MSAYGEDLLRTRLEALAPEPMQSDWLDVRRRARDRRRRTLVLAALAAALVVVLVGCTAVFGPRIVSFADADPSPPDAVEWVGLVGADPLTFVPEGAHLDPSLTRRLLRRTVDGAAVTIDLTPTGKGFCVTVSSSRAGTRKRELTDCSPRSAPAEQLGFVDPVDPSRAEGAAPGHVGGYGAAVGWTTARGAERVTLVFEDGTRRPAPVLGWVSAPIDAAFFAVRVPVVHRSHPRRLIRIVVEDAAGHELTSRPVPLGDDAPWQFPHYPWIRFAVGGWLAEHHGFPPAADEANARRLIFPGSTVYIWSAPAAERRRCYILHDVRINASGMDICSGDPSSAEIANLDRDSLVQIGETLAFTGIVPDSVAEVELSFKDGDTTIVRPRAGLVHYPLPAERRTAGRRLVGALLLDDAGRTVERIVVDRDPRP